MLNNVWNIFHFRPHLFLLLVTTLTFSLLGGCGSRPEDISNTANVNNPLPSCPDSPNCIRITKKVSGNATNLFDASLQTLQQMNPEKIASSKKDGKINTVFKVFIFRDDMDIRITDADTTFSYLHIRSASRTGESDLGVNTRRVKKFLNVLPYSFDLE